MELSAPLLQLLASLGVGPVWLVPLTAVLVLLAQKYLPNLKLPKLPAKPDDPNPVIVPNTPAPVPAPLAPILSDRPILSLLLQVLALKSAGTVGVEENVFIDALSKEVSALKKLELPK